MSDLRRAQRTMVILVAVANGALGALMLALDARGQVAVPMLIPLVLLLAAAALLVLGVRMR